MENPNFVVLFKAEEDTNLILPMLVCGDDMIEDTYTQEIAIDGNVYDAEFHHSKSGDYVNLYEYDSDNIRKTCEVVKVETIDIELK